MSYTLQFATENVIFQIVSGDYTEVEMKNAAMEMAELIDKAGQSCYIIADLSRMKSIERNVIKVRNALHPLLSHSELLMVIAYGGKDGAVVNFLGNMMANLFKMPVKITHTQAEAVQYLLSQKPDYDGKLQAVLEQLNRETV